jgi:hypothetical protein
LLPGPEAFWVYQKLDSFQNKNRPIKGGFFWFRLVSVSSLTATTKAPAVSAKVSATFSVALLAVNSAVSTVVFLSWLERKFFDVYSALSAFQVEFGYIKHLPLGTILIIHFSSRLIC